jgi:4-hydroxybenzoate polyprenyltransferase
MRPPELQAVPGRASRASLWRLLSCIRIDEVCVLQGAPVIGACFAVAAFTAFTWITFAALVAGNLCLVAHVFVLNDWAGVHGDLKDPHRSARTYLSKGENANRMIALAWALLALALLIFGPVSEASFAIALVIAVLSGIYSAPGIHGKGVPVLNSLLHLSGGALHFLLGYAAFSPVSLQGAAIACYFGLVFAAGHLTHETRDHDGDRQNGIRTNAVAFGKRKAFLAGLLLFSAAYLSLTVLALAGLVPLVLSMAIGLYVIHLRAAWRALQQGLGYESVRRLQTVYRNIHLVIGLAMLATVPPW